MLTLNDGRTELWQWDTGRTLAVDADCSQVHFSNKVFGRSIDVDVTDGVAIIPDILLQTDNDLNVWAFAGTAENGYTKISKTFKVNRRNKPADYVFTPTDQTTLSELSGRLDRIEEYQDPDAIKNAVEDYLAQNPVKIPVQSVNGQTGAVNLTATDVGAISQDDLQNATNEALAQAKASGAFDGEDGHTPVKGTDYWTASDKEEVVAEAAAAIDLTSYAKKTEVPTKTSQLTNDSRFLTSHQDISGKQDKATLEADVAAKGFTKNTGTYSKPAGGIPKADLAAAVQTSLGKADTALQEHQSLAAYRTAAAQDVIDSGKVDKVTGKGLSSNDYTATAKAKVDAIPANPKYTDTVYDDTALKERIATIEGKESAWDAKSDFSGSYNDLTDKPTIPTALPNPNAITFTGAVTGSYDGSAAMTVNIPSAVTDAHINSLIDTKLGVIENGSY